MSVAGLVSAVKAGTVDISATYNGVTGKLRITVAPALTYTIKGAVVDPATGAPLPAASVDAGGGHSTTTDAAGQFVLTWIAPGSVSLTVSKSGYVMSTQTLSIVGDITVTVRLSASTACDTVGFDEQQTNMMSFSVSIGCNATVRATTTNWVVSTSYGHPAPFIQFLSAAGTSTDGEVVVTGNRGTPFKFLSVDLYSSTTPIPYVITGFLNSVQVFSFRNTQGNTFGDFATVANPTSGTSIDTLVIHLSNPAAPCCSNPMGLDNIRLSF